MKILYSQIKELVPGIKAKPKEIGEALTLIGFMMDGLEETRWKGKKDWLISLEVRQNRPDCLSVFGLAKEIAAYYKLPFKPPRFTPLKTPKNLPPLKITVEAEKEVKRIRAVRLSGLSNGESPEWLKTFLKFYGLKPSSLLVDLSNYVMIMTGQPSHLLDAEKISGGLSWAVNKEKGEITTLDGSRLLLQGGELVIRDKKNILALAGIVGGSAAKITEKTKSAVLEMAVYDSGIVRENSRSLRTTTEASKRLEKNLSPSVIDTAMNFLTAKILDFCGGKADSIFFDYYPKKHHSPRIKFNLNMPAETAGAPIAPLEAAAILRRLDFTVRAKGNSAIVTPSAERTDIAIPEDLAEEVIRLFGYNKIPSEQTPKFSFTENITPKRIILEERIRDILSFSGFDEILSLPFTKEGEAEKTAYSDLKTVKTQNSINEEWPELRQSTASGLLLQAKKYLEKNLRQVKIFEIGKVFGEKNGSYFEKSVCGILEQSPNSKKSLNEFRKNVEKVLRTIGLKDIAYNPAEVKPAAANPFSCWDIESGEKKIGIIYKLKPGFNNHRENTYFAEIDISQTASLLGKPPASSTRHSIKELKKRLVVLDANVLLKKEQSLADFLTEAKRKIKKENLWSLEIIDKYPLKSGVRWTIRASYCGLGAGEAKKLHTSVFGLTKNTGGKISA